jgi:hypothetical protein
MPTPPSTLYLGSAAVVDGASWSFSGANITGISAASVSSAPVPKTQLDAAVASLQANIDANHTDDVYIQTQINTINSTLTGYATSFTTAKLNCPLLDLSGNSIQNGLSGSGNLRITSNAGDISLVVPTGKAVSLNTLKGRDAAIIAVTSDFDLGNAYRVKKLLPAVDASDAVILSQLTAETSRATAAEAIIQKSVIVPTFVPFSAAITADGASPMPLPASLSSTAPDGWYYKNAVSGQKINWYVPSFAKLTVADVLNMYANCYIVNPASPPFIALYTKPKIGGAASWYGAKLVYDYAAGALSAAGYYSFYTSTAAINSPNFTSTALTLSTVFSAGTALPTDEILGIAFSSNSAAAANSVELVLSIFGIVTPKETRECFFQNTDVALPATNTSVSSETAARIAADNALGVRIDGEASARSAMDVTLNSRIDTEASTRSSADAALQAQIDTLNSQVASLNAFCISLNSAQYHHPDLTPVIP